MASTVTSTNNLSLRSILEKDKLTGSNFLDWERNLMIVLRHERKWYVLEEPLGEAPPANAPAAARNAHKKHSDDLLDVACLMLATMSPDLQAGLINTNAYDMIRQLRDMFQTQARTERYDATKAFNECKMVKGTSVSDHVMKMKRHLDHLERLGHPVPLQLATDTILNSLSEDYRPFVVNYNMNNMEKTIAELHSMLKTAELNMGNKNKTKDVLMVKDGGVKKKNGQASTSKGKGPVQAIQSAPKKGKGKGKGKKVKPNKARTENRCFICNEIGHWRQNCPKRHEAGRNHSSAQQLRKVAVSHIQELEVSPGMKLVSSFHSKSVRDNLSMWEHDKFDPRIPTKTQQQQQRDQEYNSNNYHGNRGYQGGGYNQRWNDQSGSNYNNQNQKTNDDGRQHNNTGGTEPPQQNKLPALEAPPAANQNRNPARVPTCYNCGDPGHYASECKKKLKDSAYFEKKAAVMKKKEQGKVLLADEEDWIMEPEDSDDEGPSAVQGHCLMADFEEPCISGSPNDSTDEESEVHSCSLLSIPDELSMSETLRLESQLQMERALVARFRIESAVYKSSLEDLAENFNRMELESGIRESILENKLLDLQRSHDEIESSREELKLKFHLLSLERTKLFVKIEELEENNLKRGQSEHTLSLLTKQTTQHPFYQAKPGLGHSEKNILEKAPAHLYNFDSMSASKPEPRSVKGQDNDNYVMQTVTFTEIIDGKAVSFTTSPANSSTSSPPSSPVAKGPIFTPASNPENTFTSWEGIKARTPKVAMPPINYEDLNFSYDTREIDTSEDADVIQPLDVSATQPPAPVCVEKELFHLRSKAVELDACRHKLKNFASILSEKDSHIKSLEHSYHEANAERINMSTQCEIAELSCSCFKNKFADLQTQLVVQFINNTMEKDFFYEKELIFGQTFANQCCQINQLKRRVSFLEESDSWDSCTCNSPITPDFRSTKPKLVLDPNVVYDVKVFLDADDPPSGYIPRKPVLPKAPAVKQICSPKPLASVSVIKTEGAKCVGTDKGKSVKPHTPTVTQTQNSKSAVTSSLVKPIKGLDFHSSSFDVGENSKPKQPLKMLKSVCQTTANFKGGQSILVKPSPNSQLAFHADARTGDGTANVKPRRRRYRKKKNSFNAFPKWGGHDHAGLGYNPPSCNSNMRSKSVHINRSANSDNLTAFKNHICSLFDNYMRVDMPGNANAYSKSGSPHRERKEKMTKPNALPPVKSPKPKEKSEKDTSPVALFVSNGRTPMWQWVPKQI
ncbi:hypothetical protein OSB04_012535 [Centaurea solstitialis]|uniref:CCHC-type domain-containing protein n=1 Tax=Centaurea solstitialis TaxID=347529 RepID=A0AA38TM68_9ASTR|nr:hypothetical protein OSB04_012535 [Centaurea solstitialis]